MWILLYSALAQTPPNLPAPPPIPEESIARMREAYVSGDKEAYAAELRHHLTQRPNDPDVAFLYAHYLGEEVASNADEVHRWSSVALAHREDMSAKDTTLLLQRLHHVRLESSLDLWQGAIAAYDADPSQENAAEVERWNRRTRHYFAASGACLVNGDCGPRWTTEVIGGGIVCSEVRPIELGPTAEAGLLSAGQVGCLERIYEEKGKKRVLEVLINNAAASGRERTWERLVEWDGLDGTYSPEVVRPFLDYLTATGDQAAMDKWTKKLSQ